MTQGQLGAALGLGLTRVTRIEHDPTAISVEQLFDVLEALGVQMVLRPDPNAFSTLTARKIP